MIKIDKINHNYELLLKASKFYKWLNYSYNIYYKFKD